MLLLFTEEEINPERPRYCLWHLSQLTKQIIIIIIKKMKQPAVTSCQEWGICLQTDLIISERRMPAFITVTKCLWFNRITRQLPARLRWVCLTPTCSGAAPGAAPGAQFHWDISEGPKAAPCMSLHAQLAAFIYLLPPFWVAGQNGYSLFMKKGFWSPLRCTFLCETLLLLKDEIQRILLFSPLPHFSRITPLKSTRLLQLEELSEQEKNIYLHI